MTEKQVKYIVEDILGGNMDDNFHPMPALQYVTVTERTNIIGGQYWFRFNSSKEIFEAIRIRLHSMAATEAELKKPSHGMYGVVQGNSLFYCYEFLVNKDGDLLKDFFTFSSIIGFTVREDI